MIDLDANIVAVSLTSIARNLNADFAATEWVISAYTLAFASLLLPAGALADRFGRKRLLLAGLTLSRRRRSDAAPRPRSSCSMWHGRFRAPVRRCC